MSINELIEYVADAIVAFDFDEDLPCGSDKLHLWSDEKFLYKDLYSWLIEHQNQYCNPEEAIMDYQSRCYRLARIAGDPWLKRDSRAEIFFGCIQISNDALDVIKRR